MRNTMRVNEAWTNFLTDGIFHHLESFEVPWKLSIPSVSLDADYHGNNSGRLLTSTLTDICLEYECRALSSSERTILAKTIYDISGKRWQKLWETMSFDYDPISNYHMHEIMTDDETVHEYGKSHLRTDNLSHTKTGTDTETLNLSDTRTDNLTHEKTGTDTETLDLSDTRTDDLTHEKTGTETERPLTTQTRTDNLSSIKESRIAGFNSSDYNNSDRENKSDTGTQTNAITGTNTTEYDVTDSDSGTQVIDKTGTTTTEYDTTDRDIGTQTIAKTGTDSIAHNTVDQDTGTQSDVDSGSDTDTRNYHLERYGNIGVTTSQQMIESERSLWAWDFIRAVVYPDINRVLTSPIY